MKSITRTIKVTTVTPAAVSMENNNVVTHPLEPIKFYGSVTEKKMKSEIRKEYGDNIVILSECEEVKVYEMDVETFISNAKEI